MPGYFWRVADALGALLEVGRVLIAGENGDVALAAHDLGQFIHDLGAALLVVDRVGDETLAVGRVGIERATGTPFFTAE